MAGGLCQCRPLHLHGKRIEGVVDPAHLGRIADELVPTGNRPRHHPPTSVEDPCRTPHEDGVQPFVGLPAAGFPRYHTDGIVECRAIGVVLDESVAHDDVTNVQIGASRTRDAREDDAESTILGQGTGCQGSIDLADTALRQ